MFTLTVIESHPDTDDITRLSRTVDTCDVHKLCDDINRSIRPPEPVVIPSRRPYVKRMPRTSGEVVAEEKLL